MKIECPDCDRVLEFVNPAVPIEPWLKMYGEILAPGERGRMRCPWCWGQEKHQKEERSVLSVGSWGQLPPEDRSSVYDKIAKLQAKYEKELKKHPEGAIRFRRATQMVQALRYAVQALKLAESEPGEVEVNDTEDVPF